MERGLAKENLQTRTEKRVILLSVIVSICTIALAITTVGILRHEYGKPGICSTSGRVRAASKILQLIDSSVDPCEDFYQFSCGRFIKETIIPEGEYGVSMNNVINDLVIRRLRIALEEPLELDELKPTVLIKKLYKACRNETLIKQIDLKHVKEILASVGGWPVLDGSKWNEIDFNWERSIYKLNDIGFKSNYLITFFVDVDYKNTSRRVIYIDQAFLVAPRDIMTQGLKHKFVKAYYDYMVDVAVIFGADQATATKELLEVLEFQILLANISIPSEDRDNSNATYNHMTIRELQLKYRTIPWLKLINMLLLSYETVTNDDFVIVVAPAYLTELEKLMQQIPKRVQANYIMWETVIKRSLSYLPEKLRKRQQQFAALVTSNTAVVPRWKQCTAFSIKVLNIAAGALYVRKYVKEDVRVNVEILVSNIQAQLKSTLKRADWMDEKTRQKALEKIDAMKTDVGYPSELLDDAKLEKYYEGLELDEENLLKSWLNIGRFSAITSFKKLRLPGNTNEWTEHKVLTSNAFYFPYENRVLLPAGILQGVFYDYDRPNYMNYGAIGSVIGHEMVHGFGNVGRLYDKNGDFVDWWLPETNQMFMKRAQCLLKYYDNYIVPEIGSHLNTTSALDETIADIVGLKQAYLAYSRWVRINGEEPRLPGLKYTSRQLFWISAGSYWCSKIPLETLQRKSSARYLPNKYRLLGAFSNQKAFAKDFNCKINTPMNPINKCLRDF